MKKLFLLPLLALFVLACSNDPITFQEEEALLEQQTVERIFEQSVKDDLTKEFEYENQLTTNRGEFNGCTTQDYSVFYSQDLGSWVISDLQSGEVTPVTETSAQQFCKLIAGITGRMGQSEELCAYGNHRVYKINGIWYESVTNGGQIDSWMLEDIDGNPADDAEAGRRCRQLAGIFDND